MQNHKAKYQLQTTVDSCELVVFVLIEHDCYSQHRHLFPYMVYPNDPNYQAWKDIALINLKHNIQQNLQAQCLNIKNIKEMKSRSFSLFLEDIISELKKAFQISRTLNARQIH
jgi:hypothetical protein